MGSYGQTLMKDYLETMIGEWALVDVRPDWLNGLELDLFWPALGFAVEFQGDQHFVPSFGLNALFTQRGNDQRKRKLCEAHGVQLLRVDAMDLEYTTLYRKLKKPLSPHPRLLGFIKRREIRRRLWELNRRSIEYRKTLKGRFNSPTAFRKGRTRKEAKKAVWGSIPVWQIIQAKKDAQAKRNALTPRPRIGAGMARAALLAI